MICKRNNGNEALVTLTPAPPESPNVKLPMLHSHIASKAIAIEIAHGHTAGPFPEPLLSNIQCSPLGVTPNKDETWCVFLDYSLTIHPLMISNPRRTTLNSTQTLTLQTVAQHNNFKICFVVFFRWLAC